MRSLHIFVYFADRSDEIDVEVVDHIVDHDEQHNHGSILEVSQLNVHGPELHSPADLGVDGRRGLQTHRVPVGALQVLEVLHGVWGRGALEFVRVGRDRVAREQTRDVGREYVIDSLLHQHVYVFLIHGNGGRVVVHGLVYELVFGQVLVRGRVPALWNVLLTIGVPFFFVPAVH